METIPKIYLAYGAILFGFVMLVWSADRFVAGAAAIAKNLGVTPMVIGLTIVSFGTSAPEVLVSVNASLNQTGDLAIGNAIGSNIANIALVLAVTTLICRIPVNKHLLTDELPALMLVSILAGFFLWDYKIGNMEGWTLLLLVIPVMFYLVYRKKQELSHDELAEGEMMSEDDIPELSKAMALFWFVLGLVVLIISSRILVWGGETTAIHFGVSTLVIGLTIIAVGTSLPELAASLASALKGHHDIALGNIVGSNIFNLAVVMALPGVIYPIGMEEQVLYRDYLFMMGCTIFLAIVVIYSLYRSKKTTINSSNSKKDMSKTLPSIGWISGAILLLAYVGYYFVLFTQN